MVHFKPYFFILKAFRDILQHFKLVNSCFFCFFLTNRLFLWHCEIITQYISSILIWCIFFTLWTKILAILRCNFSGFFNYQLIKENNNGKTNNKNKRPSHSQVQRNIQYTTKTDTERLIYSHSTLAKKKS